MSDSPRILTVVFNLGHGGTQRAAQNYSLGYAQQQIPVAVLGWQEGGPREDLLREAGIPVFTGVEGVRQASDWGPTLVHIHRWGDASPEEAALLSHLRRLPQRPRVIETNVFGRVDRTPARHLIDVHLQLSAWCLWRWRRWSRGLHPPPLGVVVPYAVECDAFRPSSPDERTRWREQYGIPAHAVLYGRIGQPIRWKWHRGLFDAFAQVAARQANAWLLLVGLPPELRAALEALPPDVRARITEIPFLAGDEALRQAYSSMDVFVHAAEIGETFGMVLAEAMLCHTPVVTLSRPMRDNSQLEVVGHGVGGLVAASVRTLADAMLLLGTNASLREEMGRQGAASIRQRFNLPRVTDLLMEVIQHTLRAPSRDALALRLRSSSALNPGVSRHDIRRLLAQSVGRPRRVEIAAADLLHLPAVHDAWKRVKSLRPSG